MRGKVFLLGLISFLIVAFGQPTVGPWLGPIAAFVGYALFWRAIRIYPFSKQRFWRATLWYGAISLIQLSWMSSISFQGIYILFVWLALAVWLGLQFGLLSILIPYHRPLTFPRILAIASVWTLLEWIRFQVLCGYSWNPAGLALSNPVAIQLAAVFGVLGLSFWVIFANLVGLRALLLKRIPHYVVWVFVGVAPYLFGVAHLSYHKGQREKSENQQELSCVLVQTGLLPSEKVPLSGKVQAFISPYNQWERILTYLEEHKEARPDLIVLPEVTVPFSSNQCIYTESGVQNVFASVFGGQGREVFPDSVAPFGRTGTTKVSNAYWAQAIANLFGSEVIVGLAHTDDEGKSYNSAFHMRPNEQSVGRYDKRVLMPLVEYLPFAFLTPLVERYGITGFCTHGKRADVFEGPVPLSVSICYEETFPSKVREGRVNGAKLLVNVTNDGWYPFSRLASQHYELARLRAVENGAPLIRACNTGITAAINSFGETKGALKEYDQKEKIHAGSLFAKFNLYDYPTLYVLWGNKGIVWTCCLLLGTFLVFKRELRW